MDYIGTELYLYVLREQSVYKVTTEGELVTPDSVPEGVCEDSWNENWENTYYTKQWSAEKLFICIGHVI